MIIENKIKDDPLMYKTPANLHRSTSNLIHSIGRHHSQSEREIGAIDRRGEGRRAHLSKSGNDSLSDINRDRKEDVSASGSSTLNESEGDGKNKRHHLHLLRHGHGHGHGDKLSHTMSEVELPAEDEEIPMVNKAEIGR